MRWTPPQSRPSRLLDSYRATKPEEISLEWADFFGNKAGRSAICILPPPMGRIIRNKLRRKVEFGHGGLPDTPSLQSQLMPTVTVRDLRRLWKPHKERLNGQDAENSTNVRFHRAFSWLQRAERITGADDLDLALLNQWISSRPPGRATITAMSSPASTWFSCAWGTAEILPTTTSTSNLSRKCWPLCIRRARSRSRSSSGPEHSDSQLRHGHRR